MTTPLPTEADLDAMTDRQANVWLNRLYDQAPEVVEMVEATTSIASPLAGPVRILREVVATLSPKGTTR